MEPAENKYDLTEGVIWKKLLSFFCPIAVGMLFQQLYNAVDAVVVGQFVGTGALAAVGGSAAVLLNLAIGFFVGLSTGATVIISQYYGAGDNESVSKAVHTAFAFSLAAGAVLTAAGVLLTPWALRLVHNPQDIMDYSVQYLRIYFAGTVPLMIFNMGSGILRAAGDSKSPLRYLVFCCLLNIALDLLFVAVFRWEVAGVGWATVAALTLSSLLVVRKLMLAKTAYALHPGMLRFHGPQLRHMLHIGVPAGVESAMYAVSNIMIQSAVNELGTSTVAAWTLTGKLDGIYWAVSNSFGVAIMAFVGQNFGAGRYDRMKKSTRTCLAIAMGFTVVMSALLMLTGRYCFRIFTTDGEVIDLAVRIMAYFVPYYFVWTFIEVLSNSLRGAGDAVNPMIIAILGVCGLRVLWLIFVVPVWTGIQGISFCYPVTWTITALAFVVYYLRSGWLDRCIIRASEGR